MGVTSIAAPLWTPQLLGVGGWVGAAGSNPEHVLHRHIPADLRETTALQQLLPCELL